MSDLARSAYWIGLGDNFYVVPGDSQLAHFQDCVVQGTPEDNLKLCVDLGNKVGSLKVEIV